MNGEIVISAGILASITLEFLKRILRWKLKNPEFDFPMIFYYLLIPFLAALWNVALFYIGLGDPLQYTWMYFLQWLISIFVQLAAYYLGIQPLKQYSKDYKMKNL